MSDSHTRRTHPAELDDVTADFEGRRQFLYGNRWDFVATIVRIVKNRSNLMVPIPLVP